MGKVFKQAEVASKAANDKHIAARREACDAHTSADRWGFAAMIPVVNYLVALPMYFVRADQAKSADEKELVAETAVTEARCALKQATSAQEQARVMHVPTRARN